MEDKKDERKRPKVIARKRAAVHEPVEKGVVQPPGRQVFGPAVLSLDFYLQLRPQIGGEEYDNQLTDHAAMENALVIARAMVTAA